MFAGFVPVRVKKRFRREYEHASPTDARPSPAKSQPAAGKPRCLVPEASAPDHCPGTAGSPHNRRAAAEKADCDKVLSHLTLGIQHI